MDGLRARVIDLLAENPGEACIDALCSFIGDRMAEQYCSAIREGYSRGYDDGYDVGANSGLGY